MPQPHPARPAASPRRTLRALAAFLCLGLWALPALAHKVNLFAFAEGGQVYVQGYFSDGKRPKGGKVSVYGPDGQLLLEGRTNDQGEFTFPAPAVSPVEIVLDAELGHTARMKLDLAGERDQAPGDPNAGLTADAGAAGSAGATVDRAALEALVHRAVAKGVLPLAREVDALKSRVSTDRILAGIGAILALLGGVAFVQARRLREEALQARAGQAPGGAGGPEGRS